MSLDHGKVTISLLSKDANHRKSITFTVIGDTDKFVRHYKLIGSDSGSTSKMKLSITIKGNYAYQTEYYFSDNHDLIEAVVNQDDSNLKKFFH